MGHEYYVALEDEAKRSQFWDELRCLLRSSPFIIDEKPQVLIFKGQESVHGWEYDLRIFGPSPVMLEVSSWPNDLLQNIITIFAEIKSSFMLDFVDEDGEKYPLFLKDIPTSH